jgi:Heavy metal binding domain
MMHMQKHVDNQMKSDPAMKTAYACPMHPEITNDGPGKCSKCGMDMNKAK